MQHGLKSITDSKLKKKDIPQTVLDKRFTILVTEWNSEITEPLCAQAKQALLAYGIEETKVDIFHVPGAVELSLAARWAFEHCHSAAVIAIGCVVKGDTPHFEYVCQSVTAGLTNTSLYMNKPVIFGVLTVNTQEQAEERVKAKKGAEFAYTAIKMLMLESDLIKIHEKPTIGFGK